MHCEEVTIETIETEVSSGEFPGQERHPVRALLAAEYKHLSSKFDRVELKLGEFIYRADQGGSSIVC
jgi:hypothetical protein